MLLAAQSMAVGTVMVRWVSKYSDPVMATGWVSRPFCIFYLFKLIPLEKSLFNVHGNSPTLKMADDPMIVIIIYYRCKTHVRAGNYCSDNCRITYYRICTSDSQSKVHSVH